MRAASNAKHRIAPAGWPRFSGERHQRRWTLRHPVAAPRRRPRSHACGNGACGANYPSHRGGSIGPARTPGGQKARGPSSGRELTLRSERVYAVGRDPGSDLAVDDPQMSRTHFEVEFRDAAVAIRAVSSTSAVRLCSADLEPRRKAAWPAHRMVKAGGSVFAFVGPPGLAYDRSALLHTRGAAAATAGSAGAATGVADTIRPPASSKTTSDEEAEEATLAAAPEDAVLSARGATPPIARIDDERRDAPVAVNPRLREPFALRLAFILFAIAAVSTLVALAYALIL